MPFIRRPAMPAAIALDLDAGRVEVRVRADARARRYTLRVPATGEGPCLTVPPRGSLADAIRFLDRQRGWIAARLAARPAGTALVPGSLVPLRGVEHLLVHRPGRGTAWLEPVAVPGSMPAIAGAGAPEHFARRIRDFLKREARDDLTEAVARHTAALGLAAPPIRLGDPKSRWGSCSWTGGLSFSWRIVMAPPGVLDYLAAHEVAHLREANHGPRFWRLVEALRPGHAADRAWLKANGAALHAVG